MSIAWIAWAFSALDMPGAVSSMKSESIWWVVLLLGDRLNVHLK